MSERLFREASLTEEEILAKYPQGSPDYPTHSKGCGCSGCHASWVEWQTAHVIYDHLRSHLTAALRERDEAMAKLDQATIAMQQTAVTVALACRETGHESEARAIEEALTDALAAIRGTEGKEES